MQIVAKQRDEFECYRYFTDVTVFKAEMFIFLDKTGVTGKMLRGVMPTADKGSLPAHTNY